MFQHGCQVAAHFKSESKQSHGQDVTDMTEQEAPPPLGCGIPSASVHSECVENTLARTHVEIFSAPALTNLLYRKFTGTSEENLSSTGTFLSTATGWIQQKWANVHVFWCVLGFRGKNISCLETCLVIGRLSDLFLPSQPRNVPSFPCLPAVLLQPGATEKWQHVRMKIIM